MTNESVLILGALSDIAKSIAEKYCQNGYNLHLTARKIDDLKLFSKNLKVQYDVNVNIYELDLLKTETYNNFIQSLNETPSIIICAVGLLGNQKENENNLDLRTKVLRTNFEGPINIISNFANIYEKQGFGTIVGISSVAGDRGKASNYIYGSAKAGFTVFLSGLRNRLAKKNVHVLTVLPGTVHTKMTSGMKLPKLFTSNPDQVANDIYNAVRKKKDIIYTMKIWRLIMFVIKCIPERFFKNKSF